MLQHKKLHRNNLDLIQKHLYQSNYPQYFILPLIQNRLQLIRSREKTSNSTNENPPNIEREDITNAGIRVTDIRKCKRTIGTSLPYIPEFFEKTTGVFKKHNIAVFSTIDNNLSNLIIKGKNKLGTTWLSSYLHRSNVEKIVIQYQRT